MNFIEDHEAYLEHFIDDIEPYEEFERILTHGYKFIPSVHKDTMYLMISMMIRLEIIKHNQWHFEKLLFKKVSLSAAKCIQIFFAFVDSCNIEKKEWSTGRLHDLSNELSTIENSIEYKKAITQLKSGKSSGRKTEDFIVRDAYALIERLYNENPKVTDKHIIFMFKKELGVKISKNASAFKRFIKPRIESLRDGSLQLRRNQLISFNSAVEFYRNGGYSNLEKTLYAFSALRFNSNLVKKPEIVEGKNNKNNKV